MEVRNIDLQMLAQQVFGNDTSWHHLKVQEQAGLLRWALTPRHHYILDPQAPYCKFWDFILLAALLYCAIVTPWEVSFLIIQPTSFTGPFFIINTCVDCVFCKDMLMQFFLMVQVRDEEGRKKWIRSQRRIGMRYLRGWFVLDLVSILPFEAVGALLKDAALQRLKVIRIIRLLRLLKLARVLRATRLVERWQGKMLATRNSTMSLVKFVCMLIFLSHWMACVWGLVGNYFGEDNLECVPGRSWETKNIVSSLENPSGRSWIVDRGDLWSPDSPCNPWHVYIASLHFAIMTITSIGYGNIVPTRSEEYFVGVFCQLGGGITWAYVIGACCGIIAVTNRQRSYFERAMDALNLMLEANHVDHDVRMRAREFLREARHHQFLMRTRELTSVFSRELRADLTSELAIGSGISQVWYLKQADSTMILRIAQEFDSCMLAAKEVADSLIGQLCILERGAVARAGRILVPIMVWGEDIILSCAALQVPDPVLTLTYSDVLALSRERLFPIVNEYPHEASRLRIAAAKIGLRRWATVIAQTAKRGGDSNKLKLPKPMVAHHAFLSIPGTPSEKPSDAGSNCSADSYSPTKLSPSELFYRQSTEELKDSQAAVLKELHDTRRKIADGFGSCTRALVSSNSSPRQNQSTWVSDESLGAEESEHVADEADQASTYRLGMSPVLPLAQCIGDASTESCSNGRPQELSPLSRKPSPQVQPWSPRAGQIMERGCSNGTADYAAERVGLADIERLSRQLAAFSGQLALLRPLLPPPVSVV
jgi:potassium voltage-gated channel Eag-related subfamily H protein 7